MSQRPHILLTNDDGVHAEGLNALRESLARWSDVTVVAPLANQSGCSHGITIHRPLRCLRLAPSVHSVDGTPADCVYVAFHYAGVLPKTPDLVISGINHGVNLGSDVFYSGTIAGAREAALRGFSAVAISQQSSSTERALGNFATCASFLDPYLRAMLQAPHIAGEPVFLNVNVPNGPIRGVRTTKLGRRRYDNEITVRQDPQGQNYLWLATSEIRHHQVEGSDVSALHEGFVSVTPLSIEQTEAKHLPFANFVSTVDVRNREPEGLG